MVANKIKDVPDETCQGCPQNWQAECRAYQAPQSPEEAYHRYSGRLNCQPNVSEANGGKKGRSPEGRATAVDREKIAQVWQALTILIDSQVVTSEMAALTTTFSPYGGPDDPES